MQAVLDNGEDKMLLYKVLAGLYTNGLWNNGAATLVVNAPFDPKRALSLIEEYEVTVLCAPPTAYRTFVSRLRAPALGWRDLLGPDRLGQGLTAREAIHRGVGTQAERDAALPNPSKGDEWFNTDLAGGGKWEKHTGTDWKRS